MDEITFTSKAVTAIVAADQAIVTAEDKAFGAVTAKYCDLGTKVRALPGALDEDGNMVRGFAAALLAKAEEDGTPIAQARMSRAITIAAHGREGYDAYREACKEDGTTPSLTGLMAFYRDADGEPAEVKPLKPAERIKKAVAKAHKAIDKAFDDADLTKAQRKAALTALLAELEG